MTHGKTCYEARMTGAALSLVCERAGACRRCRALGDADPKDRRWYSVATSRSTMRGRANGLDAGHVTDITERRMMGRRS